MQEQGFSIQIGLVFYRSFTIPQISHSGGNGGKRCSFVIKLNATEPPPKHRQLVSIVYTYRDGTVEKLFGGEVGNIQLMPEFFPYRIYQVTCKDFESIFLNVAPFSYRQLFPQPITVHALQLLALGGGISATQQPNGDTRSRLNLVIRQGSEPPPWIDSSNVNEDRQPFEVQNTSLAQAIQKLCAQFGFSYSVDFGSWLRIDLLGNNPLANLILTRNDFGQNNERFVIDTSPDANPCLQTKYSNLKVQFQARDINRVIVAKDNESLLNRNVLQMDSTNNYQIAPNSPENSSPILNKTGIVKSYSIGTNSPNNTPTLCPIFNVQGNNTGDYNIYYLTTSDPNYSVLAGAGISIDSANQTLSYPLSTDGQATFLVDLTNIDYANVPSLSANLSSVVNINLGQYNPRLYYRNGTNSFPAILETISVPPGQQLQLNYDANDDLFDNYEAVSTRDLPFPLYSGFPSGSTLFMEFLARVNIIVDPQDLPPVGTYARLEMKAFFGNTQFIDEWIEVESDGSTSGSNNAGATFLQTFSGNADSFLGTTQTLELRLFIHRPSLKYNIDPLFVALGNLDGLLNRVLNFPFPEPPAALPIVTATHKVFIENVQVVDLVNGGTLTDSQTIDLKPYAGQIVEIKTQSTLDIDQISNYVTTGDIRSDFTINCTDANGPNPGGGGSGS